MNTIFKMTSNLNHDVDNLNDNSESIKINLTKNADNAILLDTNINTEYASTNNKENNLKSYNILTYETEQTKLNQNKKPKKNNNDFDSNLLYGNHIDNLKPTHLGKTKVLFYYHNYPLLILGPDYCYNICIVITSISIYSLIWIFLFKYNFLIVKILETIIFLFYICSYLYTALINPGIPSREFFWKTFSNNNIGAIKKIKKCKKCNIIVPITLHVYHCDDCDVCVMEHDHHCPWTGKCVGKNNLITFYCFIFSLMVFVIMTFVSTVTFAFSYAEEQNKRREHGRKF